MRLVFNPTPAASALRKASKKRRTLGSSSGSAVTGPFSRSQICSIQTGSARRSLILLAQRSVDMSVESRCRSSSGSHIAQSASTISNKLKDFPALSASRVAREFRLRPTQGERINANAATFSAGFSSHLHSDNRSCTIACSAKDCSASPSNTMPRATNAETISVAWDLARTKIAIDASGSVPRNSSIRIAIRSDSADNGFSSNRSI